MPQVTLHCAAQLFITHPALPAISTQPPCRQAPNAAAPAPADPASRLKAPPTQHPWPCSAAAGWFIAAKHAFKLAMYTARGLREPGRPFHIPTVHHLIEQARAA
jgi:hypothetical protein